jgi:hypothetical protein
MNEAELRALMVDVIENHFCCNSIYRDFSEIIRRYAGTSYTLINGGTFAVRGGVGVQMENGQMAA